MSTTQTWTTATTGRDADWDGLAHDAFSADSWEQLSVEQLAEVGIVL